MCRKVPLASLNRQILPLRFVLKMDPEFPTIRDLNLIKKPLLKFCGGEV
jgi:hypothetical protein